MTCQACEERNAYADGLCEDCAAVADLLNAEDVRAQAVSLWVQDGIHWRRDWDALAVGFVVGCLVSWIALR